MEETETGSYARDVVRDAVCERVVQHVDVQLCLCDGDNYRGYDRNNDKEIMKETMIKVMIDIIIEIEIMKMRWLLRD